MNQKATYEITITEKLGQLPLPDLKDAIWSRIEDQLDIDMPEDGGSGPDTPQSPDWVNLLGKIGPFAVVVAIVTIFLINKNKNKAEPIREKEIPASTQSFIPETNNTQSLEQDKTVPSGEPFLNTMQAPADIQSGDSALQLPVASITPVADTLAASINTPPLVQVPPTANIDTIPKKIRGVGGITNNDYRIVPANKDSIKQ